MNIHNPFQHFYPEDLSNKDIYELFVKEYTEHNAVTACKHTIVEGSRGSGKSMLFKYLEPACQIIDHQSWKNFKNKKGAFIGIYVNCNTGDYRKREFEELLRTDDVPRVLSEKVIVHDFIMRVAEWTIKAVTDQLSSVISSDEQVFDRIISALDKRGLYGNTNQFPRNLLGLMHVVRNEINLVRMSVEEFFRNYAIPGNKFAFEGNLIDTSFDKNNFLFVFFNELRKLLGAENIPFFILFDEAGEQMLLALQQKVINSFITQRIQSLVCVKVSVRPESYGIDTDLQERPIQHIHDYDTINLDALYTNNTQSYYRRIQEISNRRLKLAEFEVSDIKELIPEREFEIEKMREAVAFTADEYEKLSPDKKIEDKQNYVNKYARARFFQKFLHRSPYWYTGFDNLVHFSAGITRSFLDPCFDMVEKYMQKYPEAEMKAIKFIPYEIQWETVRDFSNNFVEKELLGKIRRRHPTSEERRILQYLFNLIEGLGEAFKRRLQNPASRYPRIISFSVRETVIGDADLEAVLKLALQDCFFQKRWYRGKSGYEMLECYILNRRLCPRYGLDLSGFQGRIELSQETLELAMQDKAKFLYWFGSKEKTGETDVAEQLELFAV